ncbi:hypothetical protein J4450_00265 [Candidatus Micrarchaeota archaeon]|nr:hypothetical protein [Candidatus Micrarchaeota archaeon]
MVNITLSIPAEIKKMMETYEEVKWSEVARKAIIQKLAVLRKLDELSQSSKITDKDIEKMEHEIKRKVAKKHGI